MTDNRLKDCHQELKWLRNLQYESDFNDETKEASFYKKRADRIQELIKKELSIYLIFNHTSLIFYHQCTCKLVYFQVAPAPS